MGDDAVFVVLSVETDLSAEDVAEYAEDNGFSSMRFAVMSPELLAAFADAFGTSAVNPPSTPHVVIAADGTAGELETGSVSAVRDPAGAARRVLTRRPVDQFLEAFSLGNAAILGNVCMLPLYPGLFVLFANQRADGRASPLDQVDGSAGAGRRRGVHGRHRPGAPPG